MTPAPSKRPRTAAQIEASRRNGAKSRGPKTPEGKAISSRNNIRHGRYTQLPAIPAPDPGLFAQILANYTREWNPQSDLEHTFVNQLAQGQALYLHFLELSEALVTPGEGYKAIQSRLYRHLFMREQRASHLYYQALDRLYRLRAARRIEEKNFNSNPSAPSAEHRRTEPSAIITKELPLPVCHPTPARSRASTRGSKKSCSSNSDMTALPSARTGKMSLSTTAQTALRSKPTALTRTASRQ